MSGTAKPECIKQYSIRNELAEVTALNASVHTFLEAQALSPKAAYAVELVLEELLTNIIKYAYKDEGQHQIAVSLQVTDTALCMSIEDDGRPFDPCSAPEPDTELALEDRPIGGLGIHLVRDMVDNLHYCRQQEKNCLTICIRR